LIDAYGIARYHEVNPAVFTIVTFPFLFGVMFGDLGHGFLFLLFALSLVLNEKSLGKTKLNEMVKTCYDGRYLLLLMSLFAIYAGSLYNECFSIPIRYATNWEIVLANGTTIHDPATYNQSLLPDTYTPIQNGTAVPYGVDGIWRGAPNELSFYNSLKMKMSILFGVSQMVLGITLSLFNALHFKRWYDAAFEFAPQMVFMLGLFGYMCFLIVVKWFTDWSGRTGIAPYLLTTMINIFLAPMSPLDFSLFPGQHTIQLVIIALAFISVPWMLAPKPLYLRYLHKKGYAPLDAHGGEFDFGEIMVHQIIHTIEFVLGAVSNTASYLRLWALSLAHSELSVVFWELIFIKGLSATGLGPAQGLAMVVAFAVWAALSFGVLLVMESLSAFLHALRLHWVEFQNKFYQGDGVKFLPFSYERLVKGEDE